MGSRGAHVRPREAARHQGDRAAHHARRALRFEECFITGTGAEVTPISEAGPYRFTPGTMSRALIDDYSAEVRPKR
jgi:branched-subunit amino acid aminotransferase/4-amino-4-deoxychorismate lyase